MSLSASLRYLESFVNYEKKETFDYLQAFKLERMKALLSVLDDPHAGLDCIHVAGTKGKGSVCAFSAYALRRLGYNVGLYTSPHLSDFRERIRILRPGRLGQGTEAVFQGMIEKDELIPLVRRLRRGVVRYHKQTTYGALSFFEVYTALAFLYFRKNKVDCAVIETGVGGRLDATNVVNAAVNVITPISLEHTHILGTTLKQIAREKAGIITRRKSITVSAPQRPEVLRVLRSRCRAVGARLYESGKDFFYNRQGKSVHIKGITGDYRDVRVGLTGDHQLSNAAVAVAAVEGFIGANGWPVDADRLIRGIAQARWPGRCEQVMRKPRIVLDAAHNPDSMRALRRTIKRYFSYRRLILVFGVSRDKDLRGICRQISSLADEVILTKANNPRACDPVDIANFFSMKPIRQTTAVPAAFSVARAVAQPEDLILVCGSVFVVGEFRDETFRKR